MKKVALALSLIGAVTFAQAESEGAFVGAGLGFGKNKVTLNVVGDSLTAKKNNMDYIGVVGYKFFNGNVGLRTYLSYDQTNKKSFSMSGLGNTVNGDEKARTIAFNVDALYNFNNSDKLTYGVFLGMGFGSTKYTVNLSDDTGSEKYSKSKFDMTINAGARLLAYQNHGLEAGARFHLKKAKIGSDAIGVEVKRQPTFNLVYTYNF